MAQIRTEYACDRCGHVFTTSSADHPPTYPESRLFGQRFWTNNVMVELCQPCWDTLDAWFFSKPNGPITTRFVAEQKRKGGQ